MKCNNCGSKVVQYPWKDEQGNILWKNMFKMDLISILILITVVLMIIGYRETTMQCNDAIENPCNFCQTTGCYEANPCDVCRMTGGNVPKVNDNQFPSLDIDVI